MKHEFFLLLADYTDLCDTVENAVFDAGFDDSTLTVRSGHVAIEVFDREGPLRDVVLASIADAEKRGLKILRVESPVADTILQINNNLAHAST